ncbi:UGT80A2 [Symbiodinium sp. CCMP2456]|nr:UGT80A2 [Symbiodinium sp. CCMP2456]
MQMALSTDEATWPYEVDDGDHFETSAEAYHDILPLLRCAARLRGLSAEDLKIYDPYYCSGRAKRLLQELIKKVGLAPAFTRSLQSVALSQHRSCTGRGRAAQRSWASIAWRIGAGISTQISLQARFRLFTFW